MKDFDLSGIEDLRKQFKCREGLLIDYDYATDLGEGESGDIEGLGDIEGSQDDKQGEDSLLNQNPSGGRTVGVFLDIYLYLLKCFAGYSSFYRNGVTYLRHPSSCCP